jgi:hypothetical protein
MYKVFRHSAKLTGTAEKKEPVQFLRFEVLTRVSQLKLLVVQEQISLFGDWTFCLLNETIRVRGDMDLCILFSETDGDLCSPSAPVALPQEQDSWVPAE